MVWRDPKLLAVARARHFVGRCRETFEIDAVVNYVNFSRGIGATLAEQIAAVIGFCCDEFRCGANLAEQSVAAEILHKVLPVGGDAEWNARNFLQKNCGVRGAICEMHMHMIHTPSRKEVGEIQRIARALFSL